MTAGRGALALVCGLGLTLALRAGAEPPASADRTAIVAAAREVMQKARYCALVTLGRDGQPQARIVDPLPPEPDFTVWIATSPATRKVGELRSNPRLTLVYFDASGPGYVTLLGTGELVSDPAERARRWKEDWAPFYKDRHRGDDFVLIRARPSRLEVVSERHGLRGDPATWRPTALELP
jgi:general stress protein 26